MANDLVVKLLLKTGTFSNDLKTAKAQVQSFKVTTGNLNKVFGQFTSSLGVNIGSLTRFGVAGAAAAAAGKVLKDGLKQSRDAMDELTRKTDTAKAVWQNFTNAIVNGGAVSSFKDLRKEAREAYDAFDSWNVANGAINTVLKVSETQYARLIEKARDVALADVDRLEALNEAAVIMEKQISLQKSLAALDKKRSKEAMDSALTAKGVNPKYVSQKTLTDFLQVDENGNWGFDKWIQDEEKSLSDSGHTDKQIKDLEKAWKKNGGGGQYVLAQALHDIAADEEKGFKILQDYVQNNLLNYGTDLADYNEQKMKTEIEKIRKRIEGKDGSGSGSSSIAEQDSLQYWENIKTQEEKYVDGLKDGTAEWEKHNQKMKEAEQAIKAIKDARAQSDLEAKKEIDFGGDNKLEALDSSRLITPESQHLTSNSTAGLSPNAGKTGQSIKDMEELIRKYQDFRDTLKEGDPQIAEYNQKIQDLQNSISTMRSTGLPDVTKGFTSGLRTFTSAISNIQSAVSEVSNAFKNLREATKDGASDWEILTDAFNVGLSVLDAVATTIESVTTLTKLFGTVSKAAAAKKVAADATELASTTTTATTEVAANTAVAASGAGAAVAATPWIGPALAAAAIAGIVALLASVCKFADGGIVPGTSFTGDRVMAGVNSGEMILNRSQQANLWKQINNGGAGGSQVEFHISGTDLVGALNNYNRKSNLTR